jgi:endonuclease/exonuclease/phosphatase family metal-dependent hydrolase
MLYSKTALEPSHESPATFPSWRPTRAIDHILVSGSIEVERRWALAHPVSDHLPVAASIRLPAMLNSPAKQPG